MNGTYSFHNKLILRTPRLPLVHETDNALVSGLLQDNSFLEAIYLASPVLYDECIKWRNGQVTAAKDIHKLTRSILKYHSRMSSRCTPFGLFSGHTLVEWNEGATNVVVDEKFERHTRFDMHYLCALAQQLALVPDIKKRLQYYPNTTLYNVGDEIRYIEYKYVNAKRVHQISAVTASDYLRHILSSAASGVTIAVMQHELVSDEISSDEAVEFIEELIHSQLLVSELEPSITGPEFIHQLIRTLERINGNEAGMISAIIGILKEANSALQSLDNAGLNEATAYRNIMEMLNRLQVQYEENKLFQVDISAITQQQSVSMAIQQQLQQGLEVLNKLMPMQGHDHLQSFARRFYNRYEDREMPLLEVLDTETGIGYLEQASEGVSPLVEDIVLTGNNHEERLTWGKLENFWKSKMLDAVKHNRYSINIEDKDIKDFSTNWNDLPPSMTVLFRILDGDSNLIYLESAGGSSAAALLGRFAHANKELHELVCEVTAKEQELDKDVLYAEIIHLPESRSGNVLLHPAFRTYEIPYMAKSSAGQEHQIDVKDLYVSVKQDRILLRSRRLNKQIIPRLSSAHNYHYNALPVYQFLGDLQLQDKRRGLQLYWGGLQRQHSFLPRVMYGNIILHLATWQFLQKDMAQLQSVDAAVLMEKLLVFRREWKLPRHVVLADGDNELLIDLENEQSVQLLLETVKNRDQFILKEFFYHNNGCITNLQGRSYANQLAAILVKTTGSYSMARKNFNAQQVTRKFSPGSEWVYFKLYCGAKSADKILLEAIKPLTEQLSAACSIDKWFFIRYNDPDFHLRLRLHVATTEHVGEVISRVNASLSPFEGNGYIWKLQMDTYNREVERYGANTMALTETLFCHDSNALLSLLDNTWGDAREQVRWVWGLRAVDELLNSFDFSLQGKLSLLTELKTAFATEFNMDKLLKMQLDQKHRAHKKTIEQSMDSSNDPLNELSPIIDIIKEKSLQMQGMANTILDMQANEELQLPLGDLLGSYIHMLLNRLFPFNQRLHEMVVYDFLFRYYQSAVARHKKEQAPVL